MKKVVYVTGCLGFIGSYVTRACLERGWYVRGVDKITYAGNPSFLKEFKKYPNFTFDRTDICDLDWLYDCDYIINTAAETHVDNSIVQSDDFIHSNVNGVHNLLELIRKNSHFDMPTLLHFSTDEVYGDIVNGAHKETDLLKPSNPYSATKAAADHLVGAYAKTFGSKCIITRCTNNFGPYQFPEKLIPKTIIRAQKNLKVPLYGDGNQIRSWIYALDHFDAIESLIKNGQYGEIYNITAWNEISNKTIVEKILGLMNKSNDLIEYVGDRPGHDRRYSIDSSKIQNEIGWKPKFDFDAALKETVSWYLENTEWWQPLADEKTLHPQPWTLTW